MHEEWEIRSLPREENLEKAWKRKRFGVREIVFERWTGADRSKEWEPDRKERIYRSSIKLDRCRYWEVSRQLSRKVSRRWSSIDTGIEEVLRNNPSNARTEARSIHHVSRSCRDSKMKKLKELDSQLATEEVSSQLFKTGFREVKNIDMNAIQPMIQSTY